MVPCTHKALAGVRVCVRVRTHVHLRRERERKRNGGQENVVIMATTQLSVPISQQVSWMLGSSLWW